MADRKKLAMSVMDLIQQGKQTKESLIENTELSDGRALGRVFSDLRFLDYYPVVEGEENFYKLLTEAEFMEWEEAQKQAKLAEKKAKKTKPKTPPEIRFRNKLARFNNSLLRYKNAATNHQAKQTEISQIRARIAGDQHRIANIEYRQMLEKLKVELDLSNHQEVIAKLTEEE